VLVDDDAGKRVVPGDQLAAEVAEPDRLAYAFYQMRDAGMVQD
jgi:isopentenyl phosphate kinase